MGDSAAHRPPEDNRDQPAAEPAPAVTRPPSLKYQAVPPDRVQPFPLPEELPDLSLSEQNSWAGEEVSPDAPDPLIGQTLQGTYLVLRVLGAGGMGRVYEARHTRIFAKRYAIKVLHAEFARNPELRQRFQREAEAAASIEHSGVVGTYDVGETPEGWPYMVCELLMGVDLNEYLKTHGALAPEVVAHIGKQLASALAAAHAKGVIHRDLKPHNIFVLAPEAEQPEGASALPAVKVLDFGLSRFMERDTELTKTGIIIGTPGYMAPEQAMGQETDIRTDVYGIGALLYAMATGQAPFGEETPQLTVLAVMNREPPRPRDINPKVPIELEIVIQKAMARQAAERYQSAPELGEALARLYAPYGPLNRRGDQKSSRLLSSPRLRLGLTLGLLAVFLACAAYGAALGGLELFGDTLRHFRPSLLEWLLLAFLGLVSLGTAATALYLLERRVWNNSARVAELVPKAARALFVAIAAYGLSALFSLTTSATFAAVHKRPIAGDSLTPPVLLLVLFGIATLGGTVSLLRSLFAVTKNRILSALTQTIAPALAMVLSLWLITLPHRSEPASRPSLAVAAEDSNAPQGSSSSGRGEAPERAAEKGSASRAGSPPPAPHELAPKDDLDIAIHDGPEALEALKEKYPRDAKILKALVLAYASRADTLTRSLETISDLLQLDPTANKDSDVVFILKKGLLLKGKPYAAAASAVRNHMGTEGAELLYQLMSERPEHRARLKELFQELRKTKRAAPNVLIAYDLRYAPSCQARGPLLERAEQDGDIRSLHQLQALSTAPKKCGWGRTCYPPCKAEAERFRKSAKVIARRLETSP